MSENAALVVLGIYMAAGYWATGKTIYANSVLIGAWNTIFLRRVIMGTFRSGTYPLGNNKIHGLQIT